MRTRTPEAASTHSSDSEYLVEAPTVEDALADVHDKLGPDVEVVEVEKVARGGIGGFFTKEAVQVRVRVPDAELDQMLDESPTRAGETVARPAGIDAVLARLTAQEDVREQSFGDTLRRQLSSGAGTPPVESRRIPAERLVPAAASAAGDDPEPEQMAVTSPPPSADHASAPPAQRRRSIPLEPARDRRDLSIFPPEIADRLLGAPQTDRAPTERPAVEDRAAAPRTALEALAAPAVGSRATSLSGVAWSPTNLRRVGVPSTLVSRVRSLHSRDELVWLRAIATAVEPLCRPLPGGSAVLVGARSLRLARALGIPTARMKERPPYGGDVGLEVADDHARDWLAEVRGERWVHLVVGGQRARSLLFEEPQAVSWVGREALPEALDLCLSFDLVLGYGLDDGQDGPARRATPLDVALAIRDLLPRE